MIYLNKTHMKIENIHTNTILAMGYSPKRLRLKHAFREGSSLLYVVEGRYHYTFGNKELYVNKNDLLYLPEGSGYSLEILSEKTYSLQIEFELFAHINNKKETIVFSDNPQIIAHDGATETQMLFYDIIKGYKSSLYSQKLLADSSLSKLLSYLFESLYENNENALSNKISPAVSFIEHNYNEKISISHLASLCNISQSHLRRLFIQNFGLSPIKYKNKIRIKKACDLLKAGVLSVSEVSDALNFESVYLFSQTFKKEKGISPKKYMQKKLDLH